jgi:four helix bundle protein
MSVIRTYRDLVVWQKSMDLVEASYSFTKRLPVTERYGLSSQIQRAAVSIPANIAEGHARSGRREFLQYLSIARGSLRELETLLLIADRLGYGTRETVRALLARADEVGRTLFGLTTKLASSPPRGHPSGQP